MHVRGVRGATTAESNTAEAILTATRDLLAYLASQNEIQPDEIAAIFFTATPDLNAAYPAEAARQMGWRSVPLLSGADIAVPGALPLCIRVLILWNTTRAQADIVHGYLRGAAVLRPDLSAPSGSPLAANDDL